MPRSSRHKSSKHSSRGARDYSDSEKDSGLKEEKKKTKEESSGRFSKEPGSGEKRQLDSKDTSKDLWISENGDYAEEHSSSKRRKDKAEDGVSDRWNGVKAEKKSRTSSESKSKRREDAEGDGAKRSKKLHESESLLERRLGKNRDSSDDGDEHLEDNRSISDRQFSASSDTRKDERAKDERYKDKYREDMNCEDKCQDDKLRDDRSASDRANSKSSEKHLRDEKDDVKVRQKVTKVQDSDFERDCDHDRERDRDRDCECYRVRERDEEHGRYRDLDREHYRERDRSRDHDYDSQWDQDRDHNRERGCRHSDRDKDRDHDRIELHDQWMSARYKESRRKRSPGDRDDGNDTISRSTKLHHSDMENKSSASSRVEVDADRERSQSRPANFDAAIGSKRKKASLSSISHGGTDEYRHLKQADSNYRDQMTEKRSKAASLREATSFTETPERGAKCISMEKSNGVDEGNSGDLPIERSSSSKASPMSMMERSPSTSLECRYMSKSGVKRGFDREETGWSSASVGGREEDNRLSLDLPPEKPLLDGSSQADSAFYNRAGQGNSSLNSQPSDLRAGVGRPSFMGSLEENRFNNSGRYKRSDLNVRRGHTNGSRVAPNWPPPVPNGFIPFLPGPPHGGFQAMTPQFPSPSLFGVRQASMEINHSGSPYHMPDAERHPVNGLGWDTSSDVWKGQNGDVDLPALSEKDNHLLQVPVGDVYDGQECQKSQYENGNDGVQVKSLELRSDVFSLVKESSRFSLEIPHKAPDFSKISSEDDDAHYCQVYLCKLDISAELAGSDLYDQCTSLLNVERNKDLSKDVTMLVNLKNGGRPVQNASIALLSPSLIPATSASVFQKAMDLYKKQRLKIGAISNAKGGMLAFTTVTKEKGKEQCSDHVINIAEMPVSNSDAEMLVSIQSRELPDQPDSLSPEESRHPDTGCDHMKAEVPKPVLNDNKAEESETEQTNSGDVVGDSLRSFDDAAEADHLATGGENSNDINNPEGNSCVYCDKGTQTFTDAISGSLNDSPKVPGSNESESVILSRIHHSPENTH
ncbi:hypothetical protein V6N13_145866 [Hibiscus sabdariffa]|uniref:Uncharacterized protein n=1 Tax=Hibiscus sabdariffa TaxID=183260 RepID=A0ABR2TRL1_9ROSI